MVRLLQEHAMLLADDRLGEDGALWLALQAAYISEVTERLRARRVG
jgi:hypothetical protein